jgi:hypothetical protein
MSGHVVACSPQSAVISRHGVRPVNMFDFTIPGNPADDSRTVPPGTSSSAVFPNIEQPGGSADVAQPLGVPQSDEEDPFGWSGSRHDNDNAASTPAKGHKVSAADDAEEGSPRPKKRGRRPANCAGTLLSR